MRGGVWWEAGAGGIAGETVWVLQNLRRLGCRGSRLACLMWQRLLSDGVRPGCIKGGVGLAWGGRWRMVTGWPWAVMLQPAPGLLGWPLPATARTAHTGVIRLLDGDGARLLLGLGLRRGDARRLSVARLLGLGSHGSLDLLQAQDLAAAFGNCRLDHGGGGAGTAAAGFFGATPQRAASTCSSGSGSLYFS